MRKVVIDSLCEYGGKLTAYLYEPDGKHVQRGLHPGILVIPGGSYTKIVDREGDSVAFEFFTAGFNAFILEYGTLPNDIVSSCKMCVRYSLFNHEGGEIRPFLIVCCGNKV